LWRSDETCGKVSGDKVKILFRCERCGKEHRNKAAEDDDLGALVEIVGG